LFSFLCVHDQDILLFPTNFEVIENNIEWGWYQKQLAGLQASCHVWEKFYSGTVLSSQTPELGWLYFTKLMVKSCHSSENHTILMSSLIMHMYLSVAIYAKHFWSLKGKFINSWIFLTGKLNHHVFVCLFVCLFLFLQKRHTPFHWELMNPYQ